MRLWCYKKIIPGDGWVKNPEMTEPMVLYQVPGGIPIEGSETETPVLLTSEFFKNTKIKIPKDAKAVKGYAYRYEPGSEKGAGRDTLINLKGEAEKGIGGNAYFSPEFLASDFRRNGLQAVGEDPHAEEASGGGVPEYITFRNLHKLGVNVVEPTDAAILPELYQIGITDKHPDYNLIAMKLRRDIKDPIQASSEKPPKPEEVMKLASDFSFFNLNDGAFNPDNVTGNARLKDPGHISFGYPITSSAYRCLTCTFDNGSSHDHDLVGVLDYYFRDEKFQPSVEDVSSYHHTKFTPNEANDFMQALLANVNKKKFKSKVTEEHAQWIYDVTHENFLIEAPEVPASQASRSAKILKTQQSLLGIKTKEFKDLRYKPARPALSMRFILQLAAMKSELGSKKFDEVVDHVSSWLLENKDFSAVKAGKAKIPKIVPRKTYQRELVKMTNWIADLLKEKKVSSSDLLTSLFQEYAPKSEIEYKMGMQLAQDRSFPEAVDHIKQTVQEFQKPIEISPKRFFKKIMDLDLLHEPEHHSSGDASFEA